MKPQVLIAFFMFASCCVQASEPFVLQRQAMVDILPVEDAFRFGSYQEEDSTRVFWQVMPGYYLYRDKFKFMAGEERFDVKLSEGLLRQDEIFGEVQVLEGLVEVDVPSTGGFTVHFQGCAEQGFCYPPQKISVNSEK